MQPINRSYVIMPSLGIGYIASVLKNDGHDVTVLHCLKEGFGFDDFEKFVSERSFDIIGIQMFTFDVNPVKQHLEVIKKVNPGAITVLGGYHPSGDRQGVLKTIKKADYAIICEAEIAFPALTRELQKPKPDFSGVPNLVWRDGEQIKVNPVQVVESLDDIPFPAWELMDPRTYPEAPHGAFFKSFPTAPIIITRGCPFTCTFCSGKSITTKRIRKRSAENVLEEMRFLQSEYGVNDFLVEDENFTLHKGLVREFCELILENNMKIGWSCPSGIRLDTLDAEMLSLMERSGCYSLAVGVEFGSQRIHELTKKRLTLDTIRERMELFHDTDIKTTGFFLMGIPGETEEEMRQTIEFAKSLPIDRAQFNNYMPLPGSELYDEIVSNGNVKIDYDHFFVHDVSYVPEGMTRNKMKWLQRRAYLEFYLRPSIFFNAFRDIVSLRQFYRLMKRFSDAMR
jgi:anaerobic magnesium-protoporphyrin IX monomethyl ester cyclase